MSDIVSCLKDELYPEDVRNSKSKLPLLVALISLCAKQRSLSNEVLVRCDMVMPISEPIDADTENVISKAISENFHSNGSIVDVRQKLKLCSSIFRLVSKSVAMETSDFCIKGVQQYAPEILIHTLLPPAKPPDGFFPDSEVFMDNFLAAELTTVPTHFVVPNIDGRDGDHSVMYVAYRPPHAVVTNDSKYDYTCMQGYVRSLAKEIIGKLTTGKGASTKNILKLYSWSGPLAFVSQIYKVVLDKVSDHEIWTSDQIESNIVRCPTLEYVDKMIDAIDDAQVKDESNGGSVICIVRTASWCLGTLVSDELETESFKVGHNCHYTYYFRQLKLDSIVNVMGSTQDVYMEFIDSHKARRWSSIFLWNLNSVNELHLRCWVTWEFWMILSISDGGQMRSCAERSLPISINIAHFLKMSASWTCKDLMWEPLVRETEKLTAKVHASKRKICHMSSKRNFAIHEELIKPHLINNIDGPITEGEEVIAVGANSVVITQGIKKTIKALVADLKLIFTEVKESEQADSKAVNVDNNNGVGHMIVVAMSKICRMGVVILGEGKRKTFSLYVLESRQFYRDGDYISHNSTSDSEKMTDEYENYKLVSVDRVVTNVRDSVNIMEDANDKLMEQLMAGNTLEYFYFCLFVFGISIGYGFIIVA
ncbi:hypothetical protein QQ045_001682 [Rhodiola kirilowii]